MWSGDRFYPFLAFCWCVRWKSEERYCRVKLTIITTISNTTEFFRTKTLYVYHCPINKSKYVIITWRSKHNPTILRLMTARDQVECCEPGWREMSAPACCATASAVARSVVSLPWGIVHWSRGRPRVSQCAIQYGGPSTPPARASRRLVVS